MMQERTEEFIVMEKSQEAMINEGYSIMSYASEFHNLSEARKDAEEVSINLVGVTEVVISKYCGIYDVYAKTREEAMVTV